MLDDATIHPALAAADLGRARRWYAAKLGLEPAAEYPGVLVYEVGDSIFTMYESPNAGTAKNTVAAWSVDDLRAEMARLRARGVRFDEYDIGGLRTVHGVATYDDGALDAWFVDSEGNTIVLGQQPEARPNPVIPMLPASDLGRAKAWYSEKLGLDPDPAFDGQILVYRSGGRPRFVIYLTALAGTAKNTVAVWRVRGLRELVASLRGRGVVFEDDDFGEAKTIDGVLEHAGALNAWFTDSEGNILALAEGPEPYAGD